VYVHIFIGVSARIYMNIYVYTVFLKNKQTVATKNLA
jgi:hypothetical protein